MPLESGTLQQSLQVVQQYTHDAGMEFGMYKCAMVHLKKGSDQGEEVQLVDGSILRQLDAGESYTYLGVAQSHIQGVKLVKETFHSRYLRRLRQIWSSELSGRNKVATTNMFAVPIVLYSFGAVKYTNSTYKPASHHPKASVPRLYLSRDRGGRGILSLEGLHNRVVLGAACEVVRDTDPLLFMVLDHEHVRKGAFIFRAARRAADELRRGEGA